MTTRATEIEDPTESLVYTISHDLKAPVRHIKAFSRILSEHMGAELDEVAAGYLDRLVVAADTVNERLDALGRYALVLNGPTNQVLCNLELAAADAVRANADQIQRSEAVVAVEELPEVLGDPEQMTSLFTELINNSLTYCEQQPKVTIASTTVGGYHRITVSDNGPGLRPSDCDAATQLFRRFHPASFPGTGTGLAIVKGIVENHGGSMTIESPDRNGLHVRLLLASVFATA
ncbi:MAG: sensor histidine kinase [Acidimicrobiales bacterium]